MNGDAVEHGAKTGRLVEGLHLGKWRKMKSSSEQKPLKIRNSTGMTKEDPLCLPNLRLAYHGINAQYSTYSYSTCLGFLRHPIRSLQLFAQGYSCQIGFPLRYVLAAQHPGKKSSL